MRKARRSDSRRALGPVTLPAGVERRDLTPRDDPRGRLVEVFRRDWGLGFEPSQWNMVASEPRSLRGVHLHLDHDDLLLVARGTMLLGLADAREGSPEAGFRGLIELSGERPELVLVPAGVAHGFYFPAPGLLFYGLSAPWTPEDELGCRFDAPDLGLAWPDPNPILSPRDQAAGSWQALHREVHRRKACRPTP
jgi:dTDP-4-dehydrorhamnose 3,5-epimerase